jgi:hypothetical protein
MWCWWCCHEFETNPLKLPYKHDSRTDKFYTEGNYCSWNCMKAHAIDKYGVQRGGIVCGNIAMMRRRLQGKYQPITPAPSRYELIEFGGKLTIEEFRKNHIVDKNINSMENLNTENNVSNFIPFVSNSKKMEDIKNASSVNDNTLKLKRNKPLKRNHNNLESALGLIITTKP